MLPFIAPGAGIFSVDSANFRNIIEIRSGDVDAAYIQTAAHFTDGRIDALNPNNLLFSAGGHWFKSTLKPGSHPIEQFSAETSSPCAGKLLVRDYTAPEDAYLVYGIAGTDGECFNSDDVFHAAHLADGTTTDPLDVPSMPLAAFYAQNGFLSGVLLRSNGVLNLYDSDFTFKRTVLSEAQGKLSELARGSSGIVVQVGAKLYLITELGTASSPLHTITDGFCICVPATQDDSAVYFAEINPSTEVASILWKMSLDGSSPAVKLFESSDLVTYITTTDGAVIAYLQSGVGARLMSIAKDSTFPADPILLDAVTSGGMSLQAAGRVVIYTVQDDSQATFGIRAAIKSEDGATVMNSDQSRWVGHIFKVSGHPRHGLRHEVSHALLAEQLSERNGQGGDGGADLVLYGVQLNERTFVQQLPYNGYYTLASNQLTGLGTVRSVGASGPQTDIVAFDLERRLLTKITDSDSISESLVAQVPGL